MEQRAIDTTYLKRCIGTLDRALDNLGSRDGDEVVYDLYRTVCVKQFELVLEQSGKLLRKRLRPWFASNRQADRLTFKDLFRHAAKHGLLPADACERWLTYRDNRNDTAHDEGEGFANATLKLLPGFIEDATALVGVVSSRGRVTPDAPPSKVQAAGTLHLSARHRATLEALLQEHLPDAEVWAYGSRVNGESHDGSDLDLVLRGPGLAKIDAMRYADFLEAVGESTIPFLVEAHDWARLPEAFHRGIGRDYVVLVEQDRSLPVAWPEKRIEEIAEKVAMGPFGSSIRVNTFVPEGIPIISGQHLHGVRVDDRPGFNFITEEHADRLKSANVQRGDIILTHRGTIGQVSYVPRNSVYDRYVASQSQFYLRCDRRQVIPQFVAYYLKTHEGQHKLLANTSQVGVPSIAQPVSYLRSISIPVPPLDEQRAIVHVLDTLDDKIALNRRMNDTLEAMVRALFKSWFIDFDPVRAKQEGRDTGLPKHLADLFPARLRDSDTPAGWEVSPIGEEVIAVGGGTPHTKEPKYWDGGEHHWATPKDLSALHTPALLKTNRKITDAGARAISSGILPVGTVLLSSRAPIGYLAVAEVPTAVNQGIIALICKRRLPALYVLLWCYNSLGYIKSIAGGSTFAEISKRTFRAIRIVVPPPSVTAAYEAAARPLYNAMVANAKECALLMRIRDTLIRRMVSGEMRVSDE